jgi:hypothetical protein
LFGFPWDPRIWFACFLHDIGYIGRPDWTVTPLYIPMARWTGELAEYMERSRDRQAGDKGFTHEEQRLLKSPDPKEWLKGLQSYTLRWVEQNRTLFTMNRVESNPECVGVVVASPERRNEECGNKAS